MTELLPPDVVRALERPDVCDRLGAFAGRLSYRRVVSSTNDVAMELLANGAPDGTAVLAAAQTAGRGRRGRSWYSPDEVGLYFSVVLRDVESLLVTLLAGVAVAEGIRSATLVPAELEWPNDIVVPAPTPSERYPRLKVGGILAEASGAGPPGEDVVVGIGINLGSTTYPDEIAGRASSLEVLASRTVDRGSVLASILTSLATWRGRAQSDGGATMRLRWRELSPSCVGAKVAWRAAHGERRGVTDGIDDDGSLRVRSDGQVERIIGGTLTWLPDGEGDRRYDATGKRPRQHSHRDRDL